MKLSTLIALATQAMRERGDIEVSVPDPGCGCCAESSYASASYAEVEDGDFRIQ